MPGVSGRKKIRLLIEYQNSGVVIHCENPCNEDTETLQTKKKDKINHGFGMGSIAQIVKNMMVLGISDEVRFI